MIADPKTGRLRLLASALLTSTFGLPLSSFGCFSHAMVLQIASPQRATFIFTSPSWESHMPVGSPAQTELDVMASVISPRTRSGIDNRVISSLSFEPVTMDSCLVGYRCANRKG